MKKYIKTTVLAGLCSLPIGGHAQEADERVFREPGTLLSQVLDTRDADVQARNMTTGEVDETYGRLILRTENYVVGAEDLSLRRDESGFSIESSVITLNRPVENSPVITFEDVSIHLSPGFFWRTPEDIFCAWIRSASKIGIGEVSGRLPLGLDGSDAYIKASNLSWESAASGSIGCSLDGTGRVEAIQTRSLTDSGFEVSGLAVEGNMPMSVAAAKVPGSLSDIDLDMEMLSLYTDRRELVQVIGSGNVEFSGTAQSILPAIIIAGNFDPFSADRNSIALKMDLWNMLSVMRADLRWDFGQTQTMTATVIPTKMTANFRSVGLSILSSSISGMARLRAGAISSRIVSEHVGLGRLDIDLDLDISPFSRNELLRADAGESDSMPSPLVRLAGMSLFWSDAGFNTIFSNLFGLTPDKWFRISRQMMEESANSVGTVWIGGIPESYHQSIEKFFADSESGPVAFDFSPVEPVSIDSMIRGYSEDPSTFLRVMRPGRRNVTSD